MKLIVEIEVNYYQDPYSVVKAIKNALSPYGKVEVKTEGGELYSQYA